MFGQLTGLFMVVLFGDSYIRFWTQTLLENIEPEGRPDGLQLGPVQAQALCLFVQ